MTNFNFLSKSGSQSMGLSSVTLASTVGSLSLHKHNFLFKLSTLLLLLALSVGNVWAATLTGKVVYSCTPVSVANNSAYSNYSGTLNRSANTELVASATWEINCCSSNGNMGSNSNNDNKKKMKLSQGNYSWASAIATAIGKGVDANYVDAAVCTTEFDNVGKFEFSGGSSTPTNMWLCYSTDNWTTATAVELTVGATGSHTFASTISKARYAFVFYHTSYTTIQPTLKFYEGASAPSCSNTITITKTTPTNGSFSLPHPFGAFCLEKFRP